MVHLVLFILLISVVFAEPVKVQIINGKGSSIGTFIDYCNYLDGDKSINGIEPSIYFGLDTIEEIRSTPLNANVFKPLSLRCINQLRDKLSTSISDQKKIQGFLKSLEEVYSERKEAYEKNPPSYMRFPGKEYDHLTVNKYGGQKECNNYEVVGSPTYIKQNASQFTSLPERCRAVLLGALNKRFKELLTKDVIETFPDCKKFPLRQCSENYPKLLKSYSEAITEIAQSLEADPVKCDPTLDPQSAFEQLSSKVDVIQNNILCAPLKTGEVRVVANELDPGVNYALRKEADGSTTALIKISLNSDNPNFNKAAYEAKIQKCYDEARPALLGPNGEQLQLKLLTPRLIAKLKPQQIPGQSDVTVSGKISREDSRNYGPYSQCSAIVHEALHLLGLEDEYNEKGNDPTLTDCRVVPKALTIMKNSVDAYDSALGRVMSCDCTKNNFCQQANQSKDPSLIDFFDMISYEIEFPQECEARSQKENIPFSEIKKIASDYPFLKKENGTIYFGIMWLS